MAAVTHPQEGRVTVLFDQLYRWNLVDGRWKLSKVPIEELMEMKAAVAAMDAAQLQAAGFELAPAGQSPG
jgi:hypothetical protein